MLGGMSASNIDLLLEVCDGVLLLDQRGVQVLDLGHLLCHVAPERGLFRLNFPAGGAEVSLVGTAGLGSTAVAASAGPVRRWQISGQPPGPP